MTKYEQLRVLVDTADTKFRIKALNSELDTDDNYISFITRYLCDNDVAPVVHGEWIHCNAGNATCSHCKTRQKNVYDDDNEQHFCGHCGAKMDGGTNEN